MSALGWVRVDGRIAGALGLRGGPRRFVRANVYARSWAVELYRLEQRIVDVAKPGVTVGAYEPARRVDWAAIWRKARCYPRWRRALFSVAELEGGPLVRTIEWLLANGADLSTARVSPSA